MKGMSIFVAAIILIAFVIAAGVITSSLIMDFTKTKEAEVSERSESAVECGMGVIHIDKNTVSITSAGSGDGGSYPYNNCNYKRKLTFNNSFSEEDLENFTVMVKINSSRIDYLKTGTGDIRFYDSDETTLLSHEFEEWNESGESFIWVRVPQIDQNSETDHVWAYYNCSDTVNEDKGATWDSSYVIVQHMEESSGTLYDSTLYGNNGTENGDVTYSVEGTIGNAMSFDGSNDYFDCDNDTSLNITDKITLEVFFKANNVGNAPNYRTVVGKGKTSGTDKGGYGILTNEDQTGTGFYFTKDDGSSWTLPNMAGNEFYPITPGNWYHIVGTYDKDQNEMCFYANGSLEGGPDDADGSPIGTTKKSFYIAADPEDNSVGTAEFNGTVDEVRISNIIRSANWTHASYEAMIDEYITYGSEEGGSSESGTIKVTVENLGQTDLTDLKIVAYNQSGSFTYDAIPSSISVGSKLTLSSDAPSGIVNKIRVTTQCPTTYDEYEVS